MKALFATLALTLGLLCTNAGSAHAFALKVRNPYPSQAIWVTTYEIISKQQIQHRCVSPGDEAWFAVPGAAPVNAPIVLRMEVTNGFDCRGPKVCDTQGRAYMGNVYVPYWDANHCYMDSLPKN